MGKKTSDNKALPDKKNYLNTLYQENEIKRKKTWKPTSKSTIKQAAEC